MNVIFRRSCARNQLKQRDMSIDRIVNFLAMVTLFEMMVTVGLAVTIAEVVAVARDWRVVVRAGLANYVIVPAAAVFLLLTFHAAPLVAAGFLIAAACPGAPYGPPFTGMAKGNIALAVGLMMLLAVSSALCAPLLLRLLLPLTSGDSEIQIDVVKMIATLLGAQLLPLGIGLFLRHRHSTLADRLQTPARLLSLLLNVVLLATILAVQFNTLIAIPPRAFAGMAALVLAGLIAGYLLGGPGSAERVAMAMATSVRNVAVTLVIAIASFPGTSAVTAATAFGLFQTILVALVALGWGRLLARSR
jgi:BASS family bile acid:Na+ symporter